MRIRSSSARWGRRWSAVSSANMMAVAKHYALNSMENAWFTVDVTADDATLHEVFLAHFRRVVDEGVDGIMTAYNSVNGEWAGENEGLLEGVLRSHVGIRGRDRLRFHLGPPRCRQVPAGRPRRRGAVRPAARAASARGDPERRRHPRTTLSAGRSPHSGHPAPLLRPTRGSRAVAHRGLLRRGTGASRARWPAGPWSC